MSTRKGEESIDVENVEIDEDAAAGEAVENTANNN